MRYAISKEGKLLSVEHVTRGLACNARCIECGEPLVARKGDVNVWHFAHAADSTCAGYSPETELHFRSKHQIAEMVAGDGVLRRLLGSQFDVCQHDDNYDRVEISDLIHGITLFSFYGINIGESSVPKDPEVVVEGRSPCKTYQPDVACYPRKENSGHGNFFDVYALGPKEKFVGIEIVVSHDLDNEKIEKIISAGDMSVRIDLTDVDRDIDDDALQKTLLQRMTVAANGYEALSRKINVTLSQYLPGDDRRVKAVSDALESAFTINTSLEEAYYFRGQFVGYAAHLDWC